MGQIVGLKAKPKRCNLNKLSQLGTPAAGEYILVSYDNSMTANGQGNFDRYIIGDGRTAATALELKYLDDSTRPYIVEEVNRAVADIQPIEITGDVTNAPDEEDLTSENQGGTDVLKFKDKAYNSALYSGLGRVYLRKNIVTLEGTGKNVLTQAMVNTANTIYHIQYDYTLGEDITIPANCVLEFEGGSISGAYTFTGQNTKINAGLVKIFGSETITNGTWKLSEVYPEWFGAVGDGTTDDTLAIKKIIPFGAISGAPVFFSKKTYAVYNTITISSDGVTLKAQRNEWVVNISKKFDGALFNVQTQTPIRHFTLYGIVITGNDFSGSILDFYTDVTNSNRVASLYIDNCEFRHCNDSIIKLSKCWYGYIKQTLFTTCTTALDLHDNINCFNFIGCSFYTCTTAVKMNSECYSNCFINCTFQTTDRSFDIIHSVYGLDILNCYFEGNGTANDAIIEIASVLGLHIGSCIFTKGSRNVPTHIFNISSGRNVTIQGNYISTSFNNIVQLNGTLFQFDVQYSTLIRSNLAHVSLSEGFTSHLNVYHRPDWRVGETIGARMLYTRNSDGTSPVADIIWTGSKWVKTGPFVEYSVPYFGTTANRPTNDSNIYEGFCFYDTSLEKPIFRKSGNWNDANGYIALPSRGTTAERPTDGIVKSSQTGYCYFDTDLKRSIYANYSNTSNSKWRGTYGKSVYKLASVYSIVSGAMYNLMPSVDGTTTIGFCETNDGSTEPVIVLSSSYSTSYFQFKVPDLTQYPYLYISNDRTERLGQELALNVNRITSKWVEEDGATAGVLRHGATADRPSSAEIYVGFEYFDETLGKPIYWNGTAWADSTGTAV